jgi:hypothetical protein
LGLFRDQNYKKCDIKNIKGYICIFYCLGVSIPCILMFSKTSGLL